MKTKDYADKCKENTPVYDLENYRKNFREEVNLICDRIVLTDAKWMEFMLNQIVNNSIKYKDKTKAESYIKMSAAEDKKCVVLEILDNGIGINASDLPRVFDKSFTGENGREFSKATGMGLYIVKKLCDKLGHAITIESVKGEYTRVKITFYKNDFYKEITDSNESGSM